MFYGLPRSVVTGCSTDVPGIYPQFFRYGIGNMEKCQEQVVIAQSDALKLAFIVLLSARENKSSHSNEKNSILNEKQRELRSSNKLYIPNSINTLNITPQC